MEKQQLPIVSFGKYKDKSVLELLADEKYVEWLKQQSWFSNQKQIYNIVVHQTIPTTNNSKTPEHNKLQNLFLDKSNQQKLLSKLFMNKMINGINHLFKDVDIIRCFGENVIPELIHNLDKTTIKFEDKFNWDLVMYYEDVQRVEIISNLETELFDKIKYKEQYNIEEKEKYDTNLLLFNKLIEARIKLDQEEINKYDENMKVYLVQCEKYENDLKNYLQQKLQNEKDVETYEKNNNIYKTKRDKFITEQTKQICQELGINYDNFMNWCITNNGYSYLNKDKDTKHTQQEKQLLQEIVHDKLKPFIKEFDRMNTIPKFVRKLDIPTKPHSLQKYDFNKENYIWEKDCEIYKLFENFKKHIHNLYGLPSVDKLNKYKKEYENEFMQNYENKFNKHYEEYRLQYYRDIIKKYYNKYVYVKKTNDNQYNISIVCDYDYAVCCELKPTLSDDYPVVLRKLKTQIELTKNDKNNFGNFSKMYILIIGSFTSIYVSKEQLITIFKQSNIKLIFSDEIFDVSNMSSQTIKCVNTNTEQLLYENNVIEENKFLTDNLLQTQHKLLQAEEKIKKLEEEILSLKSQKQNKSIKDYFGKK